MLCSLSEGRLVCSFVSKDPAIPESKGHNRDVLSCYGGGSLNDSVDWRREDFRRTE